MQITKIKADYGFTVNIGSYESVRLSAGMEAVIDEDECPDEALEVLKEKVRSQLILEVKEVKEEYGR